jgi:hypothetical protein
MDAYDVLNLSMSAFNEKRIAYGVLKLYLSMSAVCGGKRVAYGVLKLYLSMSAFMRKGSLMVC